MAIEVMSYRPGPVEMVDGKLKLHQPIDSLALLRSIEEFNAGRFDTAVVLLKGICKPEAQVAKVVVELWLPGRLETEVEQEFVPQALATLQAHLKESPGEFGFAELLSDAEIFEIAMQLHVNRRDDAERNHFLWQRQGNRLVVDDPTRLAASRKDRLHLARAAHMLKSYFPHSRYREVGLSRVGEEVPRKSFCQISPAFTGATIRRWERLLRLDDGRLCVQGRKVS